MSEEASFAAPESAGPSIDPNDAREVERWARRLDVSPQQIVDAVHAVGPHADDVEVHLKGSRASTNEAATQAAGGGAGR